MEAFPISPEELQDLRIDRFSPCRYENPLKKTGVQFVSDDRRVDVYSSSEQINAYKQAFGERRPPSFEMAGAREKIFFAPDDTTVGIVTCGGLCPGLNDVIRTLTLTSVWQYGVAGVLGFTYGYAGLSSNALTEPMELTPRLVETIHNDGGTILGAGRGPQDEADMVDHLVRYGVDILFAVGGDGTMKGACKIVDEINKRDLPISVIGVPKTIDNDLVGSERSFGFDTAVETARAAIIGAHNEARGAWNGIGLVQLMGRHSGAIAAASTLANSDVNFCFIPEDPVKLDGPDGFLETLERRLEAKNHAVIVVAEGTQFKDDEGPSETRTDASGNAIPKDVGRYLKDRILSHMEKKEIPVNLKYIDPSYIIRSQPANSDDSAFCLKLGVNAVHAAMAGRTNMVMSYWNQYFVHVPIELTTKGRKRVNPSGDLWQAVLTTTGQAVAQVHRDTAARHELS
jgi:6-phosphofructokinase 1